MSLACHSECCVSAESSCKHLSCGLKLLANESHPEKPCSHRVLWIFVLLGLGACKLYILGQLAECQAKLDVSLELTCVEAVLLSISRCVELEEAEFNCAFCEGRMVVEHVVAA